MKDKKFRIAYIKAKLGVLVPAQIRGLRIKSINPSMPRQKDLAIEAEMHQSRISMFETPGAANVTLETLATIAAALRCGLKVEFVPFSQMLKWENDFSQDTFNVIRLEQDIEFLTPAAVSQPPEVREQTRSPYTLASNAPQRPNPQWVNSWSGAGLPSATERTASRMAGAA